MAQKKGRKHKGQREQRPAGAQAGPSQTPARTATPQPPPGTALPSRNARMTGFLVALMTAFIAIVVIRDAIENGSGVEAVIRIGTGVSLVVLAIIVAALVLFPAQLRDYFARRRA